MMTEEEIAVFEGKIANWFSGAFSQGRRKGSPPAMPKASGGAPSPTTPDPDPGPGPGTDPGPDPDPGPEPGPEPGTTELSKDAPLSITKRQPQLRVGPGNNPQQQAAGGQKEAPLVMQLQKLGLSQPVAQQLAKTIAQYFKRRTDISVPVAEEIAALMMPVLVEQLVKGLMNEARPEYRKRFDSSLRGIKAAKARLTKAEKEHEASADKRFTRDELRAAKANFETAAAGYEAIEKDLEGLKHSEKGAKAAKALDKQRQGARIRGMGGKDTGHAGSSRAKGIIDKILTRFVADNQQLLAKDEKLQAIFSGDDDGRALNALRKSIINLLRRQMKRRGYDAAEIKKLVNESVLMVGRFILEEMTTNEKIRMLEENRLNRWKVLSGIK